jgi:hypothetical protein
LVHEGGTYPAFFKVAREIPVFKSEDPMEFSNYRPVSVLPVLSQVFGRVLQGRLLEFLDHQGVVNWSSLASMALGLGIPRPWRSWIWWRG